MGAGNTKGFSVKSELVHPGYIYGSSCKALCVQEGFCLLQGSA